MRRQEKEATEVPHVENNFERVLSLSKLCLLLKDRPQVDYSMRLTECIELKKIQQRLRWSSDIMR